MHSLETFCTVLNEADECHIHSLRKGPLTRLRLLETEFLSTLRTRGNAAWRHLPPWKCILLERRFSTFARSNVRTIYDKWPFVTLPKVFRANKKTWCAKKVWNIVKSRVFHLMVRKQPQSLSILMPTEHNPHTSTLWDKITEAFSLGQDSSCAWETVKRNKSTNKTQHVYFYK